MKAQKVDKIEAMIALKDGERLIELNHPNILRYEEQFFNESTKQICTAMEFIESKYMDSRIIYEFRRDLEGYNSEQD